MEITERLDASSNSDLFAGCEQGHRDAVARTLRGAGHPHSAMLAAYFEDSPDTIQLIAADGHESILRAR